MRGQTWRNFDFWLFGTVLILCIFGIAMIRSAIAGSESIADSVPRQAIFVAISLVVMFVVSAVDYHYWKSIIRPLYIFNIIFLIVIFAIGTARFGASRWLDFGLVGAARF